MKPHIWNGPLPRCRYCDCTSLEAQYLQPETKGVGPCPLVEGRSIGLSTRLLQEWVDAQQAKAAA